MQKRIKAVLDTATLRQSGITFAGTLLNGALGAVFYILSARALGPASFGIMSVALAAAMLASSIGDLGTDTGLVRFVSHYWKADRLKADKFLKLSLKVKVAAGLVISLTGIILADPIANQVFQKSELAPALRIGFLGVTASLLFGFIVSYLKAFQKFLLWSVIQVGANFVRVIIILGLFTLGIITVEASLWTYVLTLLVGFIVGAIFFIPKGFLFVKNENSVKSELFHYNKWIASFTLVAALSSRMDTFISARLLSPVDIGLYSAASQMVYIVPQIIGALGTVFAPKMAEMGGREKIISYLKKTQVLVLGLSVLGAFSIPVVSYFVPIVFGKEYVASIPIFIVLLFAMLVFLISVPVHNAILFYFSKPSLFFWLSLGHLTIMSALGWFLISRYGAIGGAFAVLVGSTFNFVIPAVWVLKRVRRK